MDKQDDRPPIVVALESQDLVGLKRLLYREDTRLDHVVDDSCTAGAATYKTLFLNSLKESLNHVVDDSCTAGAATYKTLFSVGMAGASGG